MTRPISTNAHRGDAFLVNGLFGGQTEVVGPQSVPYMGTSKKTIFLRFIQDKVNY